MVLAIAIMSKLSGSLTLWILLPVPVVAVAVRHFGKVIHELYEKIQASLAALSAKVQENLSGVRVVRAYAQEEAEIRGFDEPNREYVNRNIKLIRTWSITFCRRSRKLMIKRPRSRLELRSTAKSNSEI